MLRLRSLLIVLLSLSLAAAAQQVMDNSAVLKLKAAGLGDDLIVNSIDSSPGHYSLSTDDMISLKQAGISDKVMGAMLQKNSGVSPGAATASASASASTTQDSIPGVDEIGVYYKDKSGTWKQLSPEIINFKSGGVLKSIATNGIIKGDKNGHLPGPSASLVLTRGTDILIYTAEGVAPEEYQLLHLRVNSNNREFRSETGGVFHSSGGAQRDAQPFKATKLATRKYEFTLTPELPLGEYGILPPGSLSSSNAASAGKMFTFKIPE